MRHGQVDLAGKCADRLVHPREIKSIEPALFSQQNYMQLEDCLLEGVLPPGKAYTRIQCVLICQEEAAHNKTCIVYERQPEQQIQQRVQLDWTSDLTAGQRDTLDEILAKCHQESSSSRRKRKFCKPTRIPQEDEENNQPPKEEEPVKMTKVEEAPTVPAVSSSTDMTKLFSQSAATITFPDVQQQQALLLNSLRTATTTATPLLSSLIPIYPDKKQQNQQQQFITPTIDWSQLQHYVTLGAATNQQQQAKPLASFFNEKPIRPRLPIITTTQATTLLNPGAGGLDANGLFNSGNKLINSLAGMNVSFLTNPIAATKSPNPPTANRPLIPRPRNPNATNNNNNNNNHNVDQSRRYSKSFDCNQCKQVFGSLSGLCEHTFAFHKAFRCMICQAQFTQRSNLQRHSLRHVGFKPFTCNICAKEYYRKDHLVRHIELSHPGTNPKQNITVKLSSAECLDYLKKNPQAEEEEDELIEEVDDDEEEEAQNNNDTEDKFSQDDQVIVIGAVSEED